MKLPRSALALAALAIVGSARAQDAAPTAPSADSFALAALDRKIADLDAEDSASTRELEELTRRLKLVHARTVEGGRAYYKLTRAGLLPLGGGFDALLTHANHVEHARKALIALQADERSTRERAAEVATKLDRLAGERRAMADQRTAMDAARFAVEDEVRRKDAFESTFSTSNDSGFSAIAGSPITLDARGFAAAKGQLTFPLAGRGEPSSVRRDGTDGPGLEIRTNAGTAVRAAYAGHVAFADRYGSYGRLVILDHGEHYYTVYANLGSFEVRVGDEVGAGGKIGVVGDEGRGSMLYFEVRHRTETVAPEPWLGL